MRVHIAVLLFITSAGVGLTTAGLTVSSAPVFSDPGIDAVRDDAQCERCNVVLISVEPLRKNHLTPYNYTRNTTPTLQTLSKTSTVYTNAYTTSSHTTTALTSTLTSLYPPQHRVTTKNVRARWQSNDFHSLAETLNAAGYQTYAHTDGRNVAGQLGFNKGFDTYRNRNTLPPVSRLLNETNQRFFLFWESFRPHSPYRFPAGYRGLWVSGSNSTRDAYEALVRYPRYEDREAQLQKQGAKWYDAAYAAYFSYLEQNLSLKQEAVRAYDAEIRAVDDRISRLIQTLKQTGHYNNTIIIITSQHGEAFNEHGAWAHETLHQETVNIPLLVRIPGMHQPPRISSYVQTIDIPATVVDLLGIRNATYTAQSEGVSLRPTLTGHPLKRSHVYATAFSDFAYINPDTDIKYLRDRSGGETVYNLSADPHEQHPLTGQEPVESIRTQFNAFHEHLQQTEAPVNPVYPYNAE